MDAKQLVFWEKHSERRLADVIGLSAASTSEGLDV